MQRGWNAEEGGCAVGRVVRTRRAAPQLVDDAHSGKRDLEAEWDILSLIARLQGIAA